MVGFQYRDIKTSKWRGSDRDANDRIGKTEAKKFEGKKLSFSSYRSVDLGNDSLNGNLHTDMRFFEEKY